MKTQCEIQLKFGRISQRADLEPALEFLQRPAVPLGGASGPAPLAVKSILQGVCQPGLLQILLRRGVLEKGGRDMGRDAPLTQAGYTNPLPVAPAGDLQLVADPYSSAWFHRAALKFHLPGLAGLGRQPAGFEEPRRPEPLVNP